MALMRALGILALVMFAATESRAQGAGLSPGQVTPFLGTWSVAMTEPPEFKGTQVVRIREASGVVAASVQTNPNFPGVEATAIQRDGNMLVLTMSHEARPGPFRENGAPIWAVYALSLEGDTLKVALLLERSQTVKRGAGQRQPN